MFRNYFISAWRNLMKNKAFSVINIAGLSIGMGACLLIMEYVGFELSYDQFNINAPDIYRVVNDRYQNGKLIQHGTITYSAVGKAMQDDFPEVVNHTRVASFNKEIIGSGTKKLGDLSALAVDNSFLSIFTYPLLAGDARTALTEPNSVILTQTLASKIFGINNGDFASLIGKEVTADNDSLPYKITGICKDVPENSHLNFDFLLSYVTLYSGSHPWKSADYDFTDSDFWHYLQLKHGTDYKVLEKKFPSFSERHFQGNRISGSNESFYLQPLLKAHLYSDFEYDIGNTESATVVWGLLLIGVLILCIAWINYINLATAKSMERAKEVGVRKVAGARKGQLIKQFLVESVIINIVAFLIAVLVVGTLQKPFNNLTGHDLSLSYLFEKGLTSYHITIYLGIVIMAGIFASGFYPAFVLSAYKPALVLKGNFQASMKGAFLRKALVIGQFTVTVILIIGSFVVYRQIQFVHSQDLGFNMSQMLIVKAPQLTEWDSSFIGKQAAFVAEVKRIPGVLGAAFSWRLPGDELGRNFDVRRADAQGQTHFSLRNNGVSPDFIDLYQMKLLAGRTFTATDYSPDWANLHNIILTERAVKLLGFKSATDAIGKQIVSDKAKYDVIGVIADFHQKSLRYPIEPTMFYPAASTYSPVSVKVNPHDLHRTIENLKKAYLAFFPGNLFDYYFLDEKFNEQYRNDQLFGNVFSIFSSLAIFIACLGLFGLSLFATVRRTKEIGVRKVLGASAANIVMLLSTDFIKPVIIAFIIATPVAGYIMHTWLQNFAYRTSIYWWIYIAAGLLAIFIAVVTVSFQAIKVANSNPVRSIRTE